MPTLTQLEYILAVDRLRHFAKAAEACFVSQPSLSMQIQKAEKEIGFPLFDRARKPILTTPRGQAFIQQARIVLQEHQRLLHLGKNDSEEITGEFRLGVIPTLAPTVLPDFLAAFAKRYPKVDLRIDELKTEGIIRQLRSDALDAGLLSTPLQEEGITERPLFMEPFLIYVNPHHPLAKKERIRLADIEGQETWLLQDGHCFKNQVVRLCSRATSPSTFANVRFEGGSLDTLLNLVRKTPSFTLIPALFAEDLPASERRTMIRPFRSPAPQREVGLAYRRGHWKRDLLIALEKTILDSLPTGIKKPPRQMSGGRAL